MLTDWLVFTGYIAMVLSPMFFGIALDETDLKGSLRACACTIVCLSILPLLKVLT